MSEEQLKAAVEPTAQVEENVDEISEDDLEGVAGGCSQNALGQIYNMPGA